MKSVYIVGAGAQARETYQIFKDNKKLSQIKGFLVTTPDFDFNELRNLKVFGSDKLKSIARSDFLTVAIGNSYKRKKLVNSFSKYSPKYQSIIHNSVIMGDNVNLKEGTIICANVTLTCDISLGNHVLINIGCTINHDVQLSNFVTLAPGVNLGGRVNIGEGSWVGIGTEVIQGINIGKNCFIGAGAVVVDNIPDNSLVYGVPAKIIRKIRSTDWDKFV